MTNRENVDPSPTGVGDPGAGRMEATTHVEVGRLHRRWSGPTGSIDGAGGVAGVAGHPVPHPPFPLMEPIQDDQYGNIYNLKELHDENAELRAIIQREATRAEELVAERDRLTAGLLNLESGIRVNLDRDKLLSIARKALAGAGA